MLLIDTGCVACGMRLLSCPGGSFILLWPRTEVGRVLMTRLLVGKNNFQAGCSLKKLLSLLEYLTRAFFNEEYIMRAL